MKTYFYLYQITNNVNGKIYVGVHKTKSLNDGYMGSGKVVRAAMEKHGAHNFTKVILEHFDTSEAMYAREKEVVNDEFLARDDVYNLRRGGHGGFDHINNGSEEHLSRVRRAGRIRAMQMKLGNSNPFSGKQCGNNFARNSEALSLALSKAKTESAKKKKKETFVAICHAQGKNNSQYGTAIYLDAENTQLRKRYKIGEQPDGWVRSIDWKESRKVNSRRWFNDGYKNYYLIMPNPAIEELQLVKGRIKIADSSKLVNYPAPPEEHCSVRLR